MSKKEIIVFSIIISTFAGVLANRYLANVIDIAQAIGLIITFALVLVTVTYAKRTAEAANAAKQQADASVKMAEEMREQRYDTVRPVIDIQREESPDTRISEALASDSGDTSRGLSCILNNIGLGPAIDVHSLVQPPWPPWGQSQHHDFGTLAIGGQTKINLSLEQEDNRTALVVYYKDVYGRTFESSREVTFNKEKTGYEIGPLKIRAVIEDELT